MEEEVRLKLTTYEGLHDEIQRLKDLNKPLEDKAELCLKILIEFLLKSSKYYSYKTVDDIMTEIGYTIKYSSTHSFGQGIIGKGNKVIHINGREII